MTKTLQKAAADAIACQPACNLSGVLFSFAEAMVPINEEMRRLGEDGDWRNNHPIVRLFVDKLASLSGMQGATAYDNFSAAYDACQALAAQPASDQPEQVSAIWYDPTSNPEAYTLRFKDGQYVRMLIEPGCPNDPDGVNAWTGRGYPLKEDSETMIGWTNLPQQYRDCVIRWIAANV